MSNILRNRNAMTAAAALGATLALSSCSLGEMYGIDRTPPHSSGTATVTSLQWLRADFLHSGGDVTAPSPVHDGSEVQVQFTDSPKFGPMIVSLTCERVDDEYSLRTAVVNKHGQVRQAADGEPLVTTELGAPACKPDGTVNVNKLYGEHVVQVRIAD